MWIAILHHRIQIPAADGQRAIGSVLFMRKAECVSKLVNSCDTRFSILKSFNYFLMKGVFSLGMFIAGMILSFVGGN